MQKITLSVYNSDFTAVEKTVEAKMTIIPFATIRKFMAIFKNKDMSDGLKIANAVISSWESLVVVLDRIFSDVSEEEWERVDTAELVRCVAALIRYATSRILIIPTEKN